MKRGARGLDEYQDKGLSAGLWWELKGERMQGFGRREEGGLAMMNFKTCGMGNIHLMMQGKKIAKK